MTSKKPIFFFLFAIVALTIKLNANLFDGLPPLSKHERVQILPKLKKVILWTKRIDVKECPTSFNPSLIETPHGFLLAFRYCPDRIHDWHSWIGTVLLDDNFNPKAKPQILNLRFENKEILSQQEDPRLFELDGEIYVLFNDNDKVLCPSEYQRRDIYLSKLTYNDEDNQFTPSRPLKLLHGVKHHYTLWQKNWVPFQWNDKLMISYSIHPHEILMTDFADGCCDPVNITSLENVAWKWGHLRGGTPAQLVDGEYLSFFHSSTILSTTASNRSPLRHYYAGAYTFSSEPPFEIKKMTPYPISAEGFYTPSRLDKRVIFPGSFVVKGPYIYLAYGKDDSEIWIAKIDKKALMDFMVDVK